MPDDELQPALAGLLNQYRSAELRGAGVILRLGRLADNERTRKNFTKHLRDEGEHAWTWTRTLVSLKLPIYDIDDPYQQRLGANFGIPHTVEELLALTLVSERRGVASYEEHLALPGNPRSVVAALEQILEDERWHVDWIAEELESRAQGPAASESLESLLARAESADTAAAAAVRADVDSLLADVGQQRWL